EETAAPPQGIGRDTGGRVESLGLRVEGDRLVGFFEGLVNRGEEVVGLSAARRIRSQADDIGQGRRSALIVVLTVKNEALQSRIDLVATCEDLFESGAGLG